jgi:hypothetical protein
LVEQPKGNAPFLKPELIGEIILKWILKKYCGRMWTGLLGLGILVGAL